VTVYRLVDDLYDRSLSLLLLAAIRRRLAREWNIEALWDDLDADDSMIIEAILRGVSEL
jgi:hypothetical protein